VEAGRAMACFAAAALDTAHHHVDASVREHSAAVYEFLVPLVKGWCTEMSVEVASTGIQVHGGMGYIEETGAAQFYRDARILTIYEGTTAIQANDLLGRKTARDGGAVAKALCEEISATIAQLNAQGADCYAAAHARAVAASLQQACVSLLEAVQFVCNNLHTHPEHVYAGSVPYLMLAGSTIAGWQMARALLIAQRKMEEGDCDSFYTSKVLSARFFADHVLCKVPALTNILLHGYVAVCEMPANQF